MSRLEISELGLLLKSLSGFCGQGILSLGYYLRGILSKTGTRVWCLATEGLHSPRLEGLAGGDRGQVLGVRAGQGFGCHLDAKN